MLTTNGLNSPRSPGMEADQGLSNRRNGLEERGGGQRISESESTNAAVIAEYQEAVRPKELRPTGYNRPVPMTNTGRLNRTTDCKPQTQTPFNLSCYYQQPHIRDINDNIASVTIRSGRQWNNMSLNMSYLENLNKQSPEQIEREFVSKQEHFTKLMKQCANDSSVIDILLSIFAKISSSKPDYFLSLYNSLNQSHFFGITVVPYLLSLIGKGCQKIETVQNAVRILLCMSNTSVNSVVSVYGALTALSELVKEIRTSDLCSDSMKAEFEEFDHIRLKIQSVRRLNEKTRRSKEDRCLPPDDFRLISVVPTADDLLASGTPFLRKNKEFGSFINLDHYLDVQFRLLREDYIAPLRESIQEYKTHIQEIKQGKRRIREIKVYSGVRIVGTTLNANGIGHVLTFDTSATQRVKWEHSKRLNYGSLLCLSYDDFEKICFATITNRDIEDLALGIIEVQFTCATDQLYQMADKIFVMAESETYFEAYKHNLSVLQNIDVLPFSNYIIECKESIDAPAYLKKDVTVTYDLNVLANENVKCRFADSGDIEGEAQSNITTEINKDLPISNKQSAMSYDPGLKRVPVLTDSDWPCGTAIGLDDSQYRAVKNALTQEFSITQGPPGTGKTYVGLKIAKALLGNRRVWQNEEIKRPLLVVCYTNHALDQFLCGIHEFFNGKIVRIGGRSSNEVMQKHGIATMFKYISSDILVSSFVSRNSIEVTRQIINRIKYQLYRIDAHLLGEGQIRQYAGRLYESLISGFNLKLFHINRIKDRDEQLLASQFNVIAEWLGCGLLLKQSRFQVCFQNRHTKLNSTQSASAQDTESADDGESMKQNSGHKYIYYCEYVGCVAKDEIKSLAKSTQATKSNEQKVCKTKGTTITKNKANSNDMNKGAVHYDNVLPATEKVQQTIQDVWKLPIPLRWQLYRRWAKRFKSDLTEILKEHENDYNMTCRDIKEQTQEKHIQALRQADVIGMTTTGAAKQFDVLRAVKPKIVIVEEAAEVLEAHIVTSLSEQTEHLVLIGDHKQLKPSPAVYKLAKTFNLDMSLFERMINNKVKYECLEYQHRMRPEIAKLIRLFYPTLKDHDSVFDRPNIRGVASNVFFMSHTHPEEHDEDNTSHTNEHEAHFLVGFCRYLLKQEYKPSEITVLTTYSAQLFLLRRLMPKKSQFDGINVMVVDNYQGEENDIILLSLVRSNPDDKIGFLKIENRVNVALSRAKNGLFVIGNFESMSRVSDLWTDIVGLLKKESQIDSSLPLVCRNHPNKKIFVSRAKDFMKAPEGGCDEQCDVRLNCGHVCRLMCHAYDTSHEIYQCEARCTEKCANNHQCFDLCYEKRQTCSECKVRMSKTVSKCGHSQLIPCFMDPVLWECQVPCEDILNCGHRCQARCFQTNHDCHEKVNFTFEKCGHVIEIECYERSTMVNTYCKLPCEFILECSHMCVNICYQPHTQQCRKHVSKKLTCGHSLPAFCYEKPGSIKCTFPCEKLLPCGHQCRNKCGEDHTSFCEERVKKILKCGHSLTSYCSDIKCQRECIEKLECGHVCQKKCSEAHTTMCSMFVSYTCNYGHTTRQFCHEVFRQNDVMCIEWCQTELACGHSCQGTCYECRNGKFHKSCSVCGIPDRQYHCDEPNRDSKLPCIAPCRNQCSHRQCNKMCFEPCADDESTEWPCQEKCDWACEHLCCSKLCFELCDRPVCEKPCEKMIQASVFMKRPCTGYCGETCGIKQINMPCLRQRLADAITGPKCNTFHKACGDKTDVKSIVAAHFQNDYSCGPACPECRGPILLDEKVFGKVAKKIHAKKERVKLQSKYNECHKEIRKRLAQLKDRLADMQLNNKQCLDFKDHLEKRKKNFEEFLHFQSQGYLDMKKELYELDEIADVILISE